MDKNKLSKTELWTKRIQDFDASGLSRKDWCQMHQISPSTLGYWIRKKTEAADELKPVKEPVFARLLSEQEISSDLSADHAPLTIHLPGSIRIEVGIRCSKELLVSLFHILKVYA